MIPSARRIVSAVAAIIALACALSTFAQTATAGTAVSTVCTGSPTWISDIFFDKRDTSLFWFSPTCPDIVVSMLGDEFFGDRGAASYAVTPNLTALSASVSGGPPPGSGVVERLRVCSIEECGRPISPTGSPTPTPDTLTVGDGIPANPVSVLLDAVCTLPAGCPAQPDAAFSNLKLTYSDDVAPTVKLTDAWGLPLPAVTKWFGPVDWVYINAVEQETFLRNVTVTVGSDPPQSLDCPALPDGSFPGSCQSIDFGNAPMQLPDTLQGSAPLLVSATDAAGNVGTASVTVRRDSIPPAAPGDLSVGANADGWINSPDVTVHWTNSGEQGETAMDSGIVSAHYTLADGAGKPIRSGIVDGPAIDSFTEQLPTAGDYEFTVTLVDAAGNESDPSTVSFKLDQVFPSAPKIASIPTIDAAHSGGLTISWFDWGYAQTTFSGICGHRVAINDIEHYKPTSGAGVETLGQGVQSIDLTANDLAGMSDGVHYVHVRPVSCAGTFGATADAAIAIDRKAPVPSADPAGGGWLAPGELLLLGADDSDAGNALAGVAKLEYSIDGGAIVSTPASSAALTLPQGMHTITFHAEDLSHNISPDSVIHAGVDTQPPSAAFDAPVASDPALIRAGVSDADSGLDDAWIEYSPPGSVAWARLVGTSAGTNQRTLAARMPDDESLPPGEYRLRVVARDRAGNTSTTTSRVGGDTARITLPIRPRSALTLAVASGPRAAASNSLTVQFGSTVQARGVLRDASGAPVAGAAIAISESISGGPRKQVAAAATDSQGAFTASIPAGPSRVLEARFLGDALLGSASATATFNVRGKVSLAKLPSHVASKQRFYLRGKVDPGPVALPRAGALVSIQLRNGKHWSALTLTGRTASDGSFALPWSFNTHKKRLHFTFRAVVAVDTAWPYADGYSTSRSVTIG